VGNCRCKYPYWKYGGRYLSNKKIFQINQEFDKGKKNPAPREMLDIPIIASMPAHLIASFLVHYRPQILAADSSVA